MSIHMPVEVPESPKKAAGAPRGAKRTRVLMIGTLVTSGGSQKVRVRDISQTGAQLIVGKDVVVGGDAILHRGSLFAAARVAWLKDEEVGLEFYRQLSLEEIGGSLPGSAQR